MKIKEREKEKKEKEKEKGNCLSLCNIDFHELLKQCNN